MQRSDTTRPIGGFTGEFLCVRHEVSETLRQVISSEPLFGQDLKSVLQLYTFSWGERGEGGLDK